MQLDWMMLANYAEDNNGLVYIAGGAWDTVSVHAPIDGAPEGVVAVLSGTLVIRLTFHRTETDRDHGFELLFMDEDGGDVAKAEGRIRVDRVQGHPPGWDQGANLVVPVSGIALNKFGLHTISLQVDGRHMGDRPFRVLKLY